MTEYEDHADRYSECCGYCNEWNDACTCGDEEYEYCKLCQENMEDCVCEVATIIADINHFYYPPSLWNM